MKALTRVLGVLIAMALLLFAAWRMIPVRRSPTPVQVYGPGIELIGERLPDLRQVAGWLNADPSVVDSLRGHPTVLALWSDTDLECLRALPDVESWHQAYARYGVRVIGVHVPDFAFARDPSVPAGVARRLGLGFPNALDTTGAIGRALGVPSSGPRLVLADRAGTIVGVATGRGEMAGIELALRGLLAPRNSANEVPSDPGLAHAPSTTQAPRARVVPLGVARVREGPLAGATTGRAQPFTAQFRFQVEGKAYVPFPVGLWTPGREGTTAGRGGAENFIALRYDAGALWAVLSPPKGGTVRVWVLCDERWLSADALGADARLDGQGASYVDVSEPRLYALCRAQAGEHVVKLSPEAPGLTAYALIVEPANAGPPP